LADWFRHSVCSSAHPTWFAKRYLAGVVPGSVLQSDGQTTPVRLTAASSFGELPRNRAYRNLRVVALGLYMSVLSAFHIGWRDLNVGTWIARMQPREYTLRPTGWVRVVSGVQSLISVYLVALWVLTSSRRPSGAARVVT